MGSGFSKKKKQAKKLQEQFMQMQSDMESMEVVGKAPSDLVQLTMTGNGDLKSIKIDPECVDPEDVEALEDLVKAAFEDAQNQLKDKAPQGMPDMGNMGLGSLFG